MNPSPLHTLDDRGNLDAMQRMLRFAVTLAFAVPFAACSKDVAGPKPPSATSTIVQVVTTMSKTLIAVGDTATFGYSVKNISGDTLTLTTDTGCQLAPVLDQVEGPRIPDLLSLTCPTSQTLRVMLPGETIAFGIVLRGYDKNLPAAQQTPGYLLSTGTFDASMLVTANELPAPVRSDWVRFKVN